MQSANRTDASALVAFWLPLLLLPVLVLPFSADPFEQPALIRATVARAASGHRLLLRFFTAASLDRS
jgi:hypothetical protein